MNSIKLIAAAAAVAALAAVPVGAQPAPEAKLYKRGHFAGPAVRVTGPLSGLEGITVRSVQIPAGTAWELCSGRTFTGCKTFSESDPSIIMTVRSVRPVARTIPESATVAVQQAGVRGSGPSLRGLASEFFVIPDAGGTRVEVVAGASDASRVAAEFCRSRGWRTSAHERVQTVTGRLLLADVLCVNDDR